MKKIKPIAEKRPLLRWIKRLLGIQSPSGPSSWQELGIDEMHEYTDPVFTGAMKSNMATVTYKREIRAQWIEGDYGDTLKLACSSCGSPHEYRTTFCPDCGAKMVEARYKDTPDNAYRDAIVRLIDRQRAKGMEKYGQTPEENTTLTTEQRIEHAQEELVDALQYLEHLKQTQADQLTANDYQRAAMRTASGMDRESYDGRGLLMNAVMGLNGEAGEVIDHVKKVYFQGHELDREHLIEELGDVAWYLAVCCEAIDTTLEDVLQNNIDKLRKRYPDGFDKYRSINREEGEFIGT